MLHTPKEIADLLVHRYGNSPKSILIDREEFEQQAGWSSVDHRLVRSIDLELRPLGYVLADLLKEQGCVVMLKIQTVTKESVQSNVSNAA
jgi:hypothetical protein